MIGRQRRSFDGANVFITGAASGIGRATAEHAGRLGARLHLTDLSASGLSETVSRIEAAGGTVVLARTADVSDHDGGPRARGRRHRDLGVDGRRDEHRRHLGVGHRLLAASTSTWRRHGRRQPDGTDPRDRGAGAADGRRRPRRAPGQRLVGRRADRDAVARGVQRHASSASAASPRCSASTSSGTGSGSSLVCPGAVAHAADRDRADRRRRHRRTRGSCKAQARFRRACGLAGGRRRGDPRRAYDATATGSTPRPTSAWPTCCSAYAPPVYVLLMRVLNRQRQPGAAGGTPRPPSLGGVMTARSRRAGCRDTRAVRSDVFARLAGRAAGTSPPAVFLTLGRHRRLFWGWLHFAGAPDAPRPAPPPRDRAGHPARRDALRVGATSSPSTAGSAVAPA